MAIIHKSHLQEQRCKTPLTQGDFVRRLKKSDVSWICRYEKGKASQSGEILVTYLTLSSTSIKKLHPNLNRTILR